MKRLILLLAIVFLGTGLRAASGDYVAFVDSAMTWAMEVLPVPAGP